jgi:NAD(P)-dependent dehydrogenase (short-subunit alcohol dehydrogenase family)
MAGDKRVWFITGSSTGFGRELALEALEQGNRVVATARKPEVLAELTEKYPKTARAVRLDVTNPEQVRAAIAKAVDEFGSIDVVVNNAGYGSIGALEEVDDKQLRRQFETNVFGAIDVTRAALPYLRKQKRGHIVNISSVAGVVAFPSCGAYCASKFALEAISESLATEVQPHGIKVTIVEPGAFRTKFGGGALEVAENRMGEYPSTEQFLSWVKDNDGKQPGDPRKAARAIIKVVESENPPLRLALGEDSITAIEAKLASVKDEIARWRQVGIETAFEGATFTAIGGK